MALQLETYLGLHRAGRLSEAEVGYRECLGDGETAARFPLAVLLLQQSRHDEALELLEVLAQASPNNPDIVVNWSLALRNCGRTEESLMAAQRGCALAPMQVAAWNALGLAALELKRFDEALSAFETGLGLAPGHAALQLHRAHCLRHLGRSQEALSLYGQLLGDDPKLLEGWRGHARTQAALGHGEDALRSCEFALHLAPDDREVAFEHAVALLRAGRADPAAQYFAAFVDGAPDDAQAWLWLGRARLAQGDLTAARDAFEQAHAKDPLDAVIAHFRAAATGGLPEAVESDYIRRLFDDFAGRFEHTLVDRLAYAIPARLADLLRRHRADVADSVLDLGCGTGLMALELNKPGRVFDGVDLSTRMLELARAKGVYRDLHAMELGEFLSGAEREWDLIVAADVFVYVPDVREVFTEVMRCLHPGGWFAFSIEVSAGDDTELLPSTGRYRHSPDRVRAALDAAGFVDTVGEAGVLRLESGQPVIGELILARRAPSAGAAI